MSTWKKVIGTQESSFQIGLAGPKIKRSTDALEGRNADDSGYAVVRGALPVADNDLVTKYYADSLTKPIIVKRQADCSAALPPNTAARGYVVVSTAGTGAAIGDLLFDDGSSTGDMAILAAEEGRVIIVTDSLTGGTVVFQPDTAYAWDSDASLWIAMGGSGTGAVKEISVTIGTSASYSSTDDIPAGCVIVGSSVLIGTPYTAAATITVGSESTATKYQATTDNEPQTAGQYDVDARITGEAAAEKVVVAIANTPAAGAGTVTVRYCKPLS